RSPAASCPTSSTGSFRGETMFESKSDIRGALASYGLEPHTASVEHHVAPALCLVAATATAAPAASRIGGAPDLPADQPWAVRLACCRSTSPICGAFGSPRARSISSCATTIYDPANSTASTRSTSRRDPAGLATGRHLPALAVGRGAHVPETRTPGLPTRI